MRGQTRAHGGALCGRSLLGNVGKHVIDPFSPLELIFPSCSRRVARAGLRALDNAVFCGAHDTVLMKLRESRDTIDQQ